MLIFIRNLDLKPWKEEEAKIFRREAEYKQKSYSFISSYNEDLKYFSIFNIKFSDSLIAIFQYKNYLTKIEEIKLKKKRKRRILKSLF